MKGIVGYGVIGQQMIFFARIVLAMLCGGIIGIERQQRIKVAGTRTHMMISMAAALMMLISKYGFLDVYDRECGGRNRRYYRITVAGATQLNHYKGDWKEYSQKITGIFEGGVVHE